MGLQYKLILAMLLSTYHTGSRETQPEPRNQFTRLDLKSPTLTSHSLLPKCCDLDGSALPSSSFICRLINSHRQLLKALKWQNSDSKFTGLWTSGQRPCP